MRANSKGTALTVPSNQKTLVNAGAIINPFDVFHYAESGSEKQPECAICIPQIGEPALRLCKDCTATQNRLETELTAHLSRPRKVYRLHKCAACQKAVTPAKFSRDWGICKSCVSEIVSKSKIARSNFVERAVNNFRKMLKGVVAL